MSPRSSVRVEPISFATAADLAACHALLRQGSRTFHAASLVLPGAIRDRATVLYAFCRLADDAIDLHRDAAKQIAALALLRERLELIYTSRAHVHAVDRAFAGLVACASIPRALPEALLEGFDWDARTRRYETLADLQAYAARVAGTVGTMMALIMGIRHAPVLARATDLGVAMQLTNIARDVGEDARAGRLYLPQAWLREAGIDPDAWLANPVYSPAIGSIVDRLLRAADALYLQAGDGIAALPRGCRGGMHAARLLYAEIGHEVRRRKLDSVSTRAIVSPARKTWVVAKAMAFACLSAGRPHDVNAPLPQTRFLVDAAASTAPRPARGAAWWPLAALENYIESKIGMLIKLFARLESREQAIKPAYLRSFESSRPDQKLR